MPELENHKRDTKPRIINVNEYFLEGTKIRPKAKYLETDEKPTCFFLLREKVIYRKKYIIFKE